MRITSAAFEDGGMIPRKYTCDGMDVSPPLAWVEVPAEARAMALIVDDPDAPAGTFTHWLLFNVPADAGGLPEDVPADETLPNGGRQGRNGFRKIGYGGPCPPSGVHRYFFKLYALAAPLDLAAGASKDQLTAAMEGRVVAEAELMGRYTRT